MYLVETDPEALRENFLSRASAPRFLALAPEYQDHVVAMNWRYGMWIAETAENAGLPWVACQPWETLYDRVRMAIGCD